MKKEKILRILHITNFNQRFNGRLHYNTGRRLNNGFVRLGHNVLTISDRDIIHENKNKYAEEIYTDIERYRSLVGVIISHEDGDFLEKEMEEFNSYLELFIGKE